MFALGVETWYGDGMVFVCVIETGNAIGMVLE